MKKINYFVVIILSFFVFQNVKALEYEPMTLIPVDTVATVKTDSFEYNDFRYNSDSSNITFSSIKNISNKKIYVSISVLLFDEGKKNIGFISYCTKNDYDTDYNYLKISKNEAIPFNILVRKTYLKDKKNISDIQYISVMDDNKYCKKGGYTKYEGLTIDQISEGMVNSELKEEDIISYFNEFNIFSQLDDERYITLIVVGLLILVCFF